MKRYCQICKAQATLCVIRQEILEVFFHVVIFLQKGLRDVIFFARDLFDFCFTMITKKQEQGDSVIRDTES